MPKGRGSRKRGSPSAAPPEIRVVHENVVKGESVFCDEWGDKARQRAFDWTGVRFVNDPSLPCADVEVGQIAKRWLYLPVLLRHYKGNLEDFLVMSDEKFATLAEPLFEEIEDQWLWRTLSQLEDGEGIELSWEAREEVLTQADANRDPESGQPDVDGAFAAYLKLSAAS